MTITQDIEEFMRIPYGDVVKQVAGSPSPEIYISKAIKEMFPWGLKDGDMYDFYRSDKFSAYLFWKVVQEMEENRQPVPQTLGDITEAHFTQPRILIYGAGTGLIALGLRGMKLGKERENLKDITIAYIPGKYLDFLKFLSSVYLFNWDDIPGNDTEKLTNFLNNVYDLDWAKGAKIEKTDDGRTVKVSSERNYLSLNLNNEKTKVELKLDDSRTDEFTVIAADGRLKMYSEKYGLGFKFIPVETGKEMQCLEENKRYDIIVFNSTFGSSDSLGILQYLVDHLEDTQHIYLSENAITIPKKCERYTELKKVEEMGIEVPVRTDDKAWRIWRKKLAPLRTEDMDKLPAKVKENHIFPSSIACLSSLPGTACGIATYTKWLADALSKHYPVNIHRDINQGVPKDALILASIEFGLFEDTRMLINRAYENNWKFAVWHTVLRDPVGGFLKYVREIDREYDAHIVHTIVQKAWLSRFVEKPIHIIPHGALIWNPLPRDEAKAKLGLPPDSKIAFVFGFAADNKGLEELISVSKKVNVPGFLMVMSAGVNTATKEAEEYTGHIRDYLMRAAKSTGAMVLGKYLTEDEINLWASAADVLIFNYKTPPYVASPSGAMKRVLVAGKPIICVNDNRLEDLVEGQHCLKSRAGDIDGFAESIETLLSDREMAEKLGQNCRRLAEQTSWERTAEKFVSLFGITIKGFEQEYYDEAYFIGKHGGKNYTTPGGEKKEWSYYNPEGEWLGAEPIMKAIKTILDPADMLSVGEGRGTFCAYAVDAGIDATGIDFSKWAVEHPYPRAKGLIELGDIRDLRFEDSSKDLLFCSDIMEHIYMDDLPKAISEIQRVARKWIFYNIGASMMGDDSRDLIVAKNRLPPKERLVTTVAGHVTVKPEAWWREKLGSEKWKFRDDLVVEFRRLVPEEILMNWKCVFIMEKIGG